MKDLLKKILDQRSNGLYFVNTPTGSAKSYSAVQLIVKPQTLHIIKTVKTAN